MATIDLNSDMGEAYGAWTMGPDAELLGYVSSANIACGFHGGDPLTMEKTVKAAIRNGVAIGAHVSYPDVVGFGRRNIAVTLDQLRTDVLYQLGALEGIARAHGGRVGYVKAHGALYNDLAQDLKLAEALGQAVRGFDERLSVVVLAHSPAVEVIAGLGLVVVEEAFADRGYTAARTLVPRSQPGAVLHEVEAIAERALRIVRGETIVDIDGGETVISAQTICIHSDTPGAVAIAATLRKTLTEAGVTVRSFL